MAKLISSAVAASRLGVFDQLISKRLDDIDLSPIMVYLIDVVDESALPWLAIQLDVDGFKGYDQCTTVLQKRELLKNAVDLHRHIGTVWAIKKACSLIRLQPKEIEENVPLTVGGSNVWCAFRIRLNPDDLSTFDSDSLTKLKAFIDYYKNARSILTEIFFDVDFDDTIFQSSEEDRDKLTLVPTRDISGDYSTDYSLDYY